MKYNRPPLRGGGTLKHKHYEKEMEHLHPVWYFSHSWSDYHIGIQSAMGQDCRNSNHLTSSL